MMRMGPERIFAGLLLTFNKICLKNLEERFVAPTFTLLLADNQSLIESLKIGEI